jgi:hypothetical protein
MLPGTEEDGLYRQLYLNILLRAANDARGIDLMCETQIEAVSAVRNAKHWLTTDSGDLRYVCHQAGADWRKILEKFRGEYGDTRTAS